MNTTNELAKADLPDRLSLGTFRDEGRRGAALAGEQPILVGELGHNGGPGNCVAIVYLGGRGGTSASRDAIVSLARLFAAAPELLEALQNIENDDGRIPAAIWNMRNAAIAKATGGAA